MEETSRIVHGRHIRELREARGRDVHEFAREARITTGRVDLAEAGDARTPDAVLRRIALALDVPIEDIAQGVSAELSAPAVDDATAQVHSGSEQHGHATTRGPNQDSWPAPTETAVRPTDHLPAPGTVPTVSRGSRQWVTAAVVVASIGASTAAFLRDGATLEAYDAMRAGAATWDTVNDGGLHRIVASNLLHVDPLHLLANVVVLVWIGRLLEACIGAARLFVLTVGSGMSTVIFAMEYEDGVSIGASGIAMAWLASAAVIDPARRDRLGAVAVPLLAVNVVLTFFTQGVSVAGHVGGALAGVVGGLLLRRYVEEGASRHWLARLVAGFGVVLVVTMLAVGFTSPQPTFDKEDFRPPDYDALIDRCETLPLEEQRIRCLGEVLESMDG